MNNNGHIHRVNITPHAREIKQHGYIGNHVLGRKAEEYTLASIIIDRVAARLLAERHLYPPFGLRTLDYIDDTCKSVTALDADDPFSSLEESMRETIFRGLSEELESLEELDNHELKPVYSRLKRVCNFGGETGTRLATERFIQSGIGTATDVMAGILGVIPEVRENERPEEEADPPLYLGIATRSYPLIGTLSKGHIDIVVPSLEILRKVPSMKGPLEPRCFTLEATRNGPRLAVTETAKTRIRQKLGYWIGDYDGDTPTVGCPAQIDFDDGNGTVVERLWNWHLEIAPYIYNGLSETAPGRG